MRSTTRCGLAFTAIVLGSCFSSLSAQPQPGNSPVRSPSFSPYLNLVNRGNNPTVNYFGIVRPGQQLQQQANQLQQQLSQTNQTIASGLGGSNDQLTTGRGATFGYYSHYFYNSPSSGGGLGGGGGRSGGSSIGGGGFAGGGGAASALGRSGIGQSPQAGNRPAARRR